MNLRKTAKLQDCRIRIPGICNYNSETTVLCHLNGGGMSLKRHDMHGAFGCSACHDVIDGRRTSPFTREQIKLMHLEGVIRTQEYWIQEGYL